MYFLNSALKKRVFGVYTENLAIKSVHLRSPFVRITLQKHGLKTKGQVFLFFSLRPKVIVQQTHGPQGVSWSNIAPIAMESHKVGLFKQDSTENQEI